MLNYTRFLETRHTAAPPVGFTVDPQALHPSLFPFQRDAVALSLRRGRAALFDEL